jgi:hypothetical protein
MLVRKVTRIRARQIRSKPTLDRILREMLSNVPGRGAGASFSPTKVARRQYHGVCRDDV